jgi:hypothetical protein
MIGQRKIKIPRKILPNKQKLFLSIATFLVIVLIGVIDKASIAYPSHQPNIIKTSLKMTNNNFNLDELLAFRNLSMAEIRTQLAISEENIEQNVGYEKLTQLTRLHNPDVHPGYFYFRDGKLAMLYIGDDEYLKTLEPKVLETRLPQASAILRSRAGKHYNHYVYPSQGVAFSADSDNVSFIEIFPPTSLEKYQAEIYAEVPPFIK